MIRSNAITAHAIKHITTDFSQNESSLPQILSQQRINDIARRRMLGASKPKPIRTFEAASKGRLSEPVSHPPTELQASGYIGHEAGRKSMADIFVELLVNGRSVLLVKNGEY